MPFVDVIAESYAKAKRDKDWAAVDVYRNIASKYHWSIVDVKDGDTLFKIRVNGTYQYAYDREGKPVESPSEVVLKAGVTGA